MIPKSACFELFPCSPIFSVISTGLIPGIVCVGLVINPFTASTRFIRFDAIKGASSTILMHYHFYRAFYSMMRLP